MRSGFGELSYTELSNGTNTTIASLALTHRQMKHRYYLNAFLSLIVVSCMTHAQSIDFTDRQIVDQMWVVNDGVMGGVSQSQIHSEADGVIIEGIVSLENNGGFASARSAAAFDRGTTALEIMVKGDGKQYKFLLRTDSSPRSPMYQATFVAAHVWTRIRFKPSDFKASFRGRAVTASEVIFSDVKEIGVLIADQQAGSFRMLIKYVQASVSIP